MKRINRRTWVQSTAGAATALYAASYAKAAGSNERVRLGVIGVGGMGLAHVKTWQALPNAELVYVCDIDPGHLADALKIGPSLKPVGDMRQIFDDKTIDAVSIATPDHWHAPAALLALEAGKHVYVEKPCAHNLREGRALVDAARKHNLRVQHGTQSRSNSFIAAAIQLLREGIIGDVLVSKAWNVQRRGNIGHMQPGPPPQGVDYDNWVGPAVDMPYQGNRFHYGWRWWYNFGTGDVGNDGVHDIDIARWGLGVNSLPTRAVSLGGKYFEDDDQQFPDTLTGVFEYPGDGQVGKQRQLIFELRLWSGNYPHNNDGGCDFYGTKGQMTLCKRGSIKVWGADNRLLERELPKPIGHHEALPPHMDNFLAAIREGTPLNAEIEIAHQSAAICHLGNVATRIGRAITLDLPEEKAVGDDETNRLLGREYRSSHWGTPKQLA